MRAAVPDCRSVRAVPAAGGGGGGGSFSCEMLFMFSRCDLTAVFWEHSYNRRPPGCLRPLPRAPPPCGSHSRGLSALMPPKKRSACNPRKPRLLFLETPQDGAVHEYEAGPITIEKPKYVPTKPLDHNSSTSWVSPQFDQGLQLHFPPRQRRRRHVSNSSTAAQNRTGDVSQIRGRGRKPSVCRFPALPFSTAEILETPTLGSTKRRTEHNVPTAVPTSPPGPEGHTCCRIPSPPDIRTPETNQNPLLSPCAAEMQTPLIRRRAGAPDTPPAAGPGQVLAEDTPEHEYGVRLTWRRRQGLMTFLKSRGRLKSSQILVKP